jgi:hypothetical protein
MIEFVSFIKGNGLSGLALVLVYFLNQDVQSLKAELTDCNKEKVEIMKPFVRPKASNHTEQKVPLYAIITQPITLKNIEDEKEC